MRTVNKCTRNINYYIRNNADHCRNDKHRTTRIIVGRILFTKLTSKNILLTVAKMGKKRTGIKTR